MDGNTTTGRRPELDPKPDLGQVQGIGYALG